MGNTKSSKNDDFHKILTEMKKDQSRRISINPDKVLPCLTLEISGPDEGDFAQYPAA